MYNSKTKNNTIYKSAPNDLKKVVGIDFFTIRPFQLISASFCDANYNYFKFTPISQTLFSKEF